MIIVETIDGLTVAKSDSFLIRKTNPDIPGREEVYAEAWDAPDTHYTYEETDIPLPEKGDGGHDDPAGEDGVPGEPLNHFVR